MSAISKLTRLVGISSTRSNRDEESLINEESERDEASSSLAVKQEQEALSLQDIVNWIKVIKGADAKMGHLILATALKIKSSGIDNELLAVSRRNEDSDTEGRESSLCSLSSVVQDAYEMNHFFVNGGISKLCNMIVQRPDEDRNTMMISIHNGFSRSDLDVIILYYTGYGTKHTGDWAIARANGEEGFDTISLYDILGAWDKTKKERKKESHLIIIADSCFSGAWVEEINTCRMQGEYSPFKNVGMIASCKSDEICVETREGGDFTKNLLRPLTTATPPVYTNNIRRVSQELFEQYAVATEDRITEEDTSTEVIQIQPTERAASRYNTSSESQSTDDLLSCICCPCIWICRLIIACIECTFGILQVCCSCIGDSIKQAYNAVIKDFEENKWKYICICILLTPWIMCLLPIACCWCCLSDLSDKCCKRQ